MEKLKNFVENSIFQNLVTASIVLTGIFFGLETSEDVVNSIGWLLDIIEFIIIILFVIEINLKLIVYRADFFKNPWFVFDITIMLVVAASAFISAPIFRIIRILRLLRLIDRLEIFRKIISTILRSIPSIVGLVLLEILLIYIYGIFGTTFFSNIEPELFGSLGRACFTMFQVVTIEGWNNVADPIVAVYPIGGVIFFVSFLLVGSFLLLNMFVSIMVSAMEDLSKEEVEQKKAAAHQNTTDRIDIILQEIQEIKKRIEK